MPPKPTIYIPVPPNKYTGSQVILNSNRVLLNAKNDSVLIFASKAIGLSSAGTLNFDSDSTCIINSPKIQLGLDATEPLLLGNKTTDLLKELLKKLTAFSEALSKAQAYVGGSKYPMTEINNPSADLKLTCEQLLTNLNDIKSKQNFTL